MEVACIGVPFRIEGYSSNKRDSEEFTYTWYWIHRLTITYGSDHVSDRDLILTTEEQFFQAISLVQLGITNKETLQQLLGV